MMKHSIAAVVLIAFMVALTSPAAAQICQVSGGNAVTITAGTSAAVTPAYDPFAGGDTIFTFGVTVTNPHPSRSCDFSLSFTRATLPATMSSGTSTLQYSIESTGGATLLQTTGFVFGSSPPPANRIDDTVATQSSKTIQVRIRIPAGQTSASAGNYSDASVTIGIYDRLGNFVFRVVQETTFTVTATVVSSCILPPPDIAAHDFTTAITQGLPNAAVVRRSTFTGVACTQPAKIRLTGSALQPTVAVGAATGFDNTINWVATGVFGAATVTHQTATASATTSTGFNVTSGAVSGATITVDINLVAGNPIIAGNYTGILTVTIDPSL